MSHLISRKHTQIQNIVYTQYILIINKYNIIIIINNNKMNKERKLITLSREIVDDIERKIREEDPEFNFSAWVEEKWADENMTEKGLKIQQSFHEKMARKFKNKANYSAKKRGKLVEKLSEEQKKQLLSSRKIIKKKVEFFEGQRKLWNNKFPDFKLSVIQFKDLLGLEGENGN